VSWGFRVVGGSRSSRQSRTRGRGGTNDARSRLQRWLSGSIGRLLALLGLNIFAEQNAKIILERACYSCMQTRAREG
jgi:hypothetical protein